MRISAFFVLAAYLAANAYVAARTSIFLHRNLPERVAKLVSLLTAACIPSSRWACRWGIFCRKER